MEPGLNDHAASLRPLRAMHDVLATLRGDVLDGTGTRRATLQVADAVEGSLRLLLRDDPRVSTPVRLRALAADELRTPELLGELRQHGRISMALAAAIHELFETRRRLEQGAALDAEDAVLAVRVAERLEAEILRAAPAGREPAVDSGPAAPDPRPEGGAAPAARRAEAPDRGVADPAPAASPATTARPVPWAWVAAAGALLVALLAVLLVALPGDRREAELAQGISLFRSGAYADAAAYFWRYAEANPEDATPHLYLARIHRRMERLPLAAEELEKAIALAPDDADVQGELGFLLLDTRRYDVAVERFRAALRLEPEAAGSWIGLVRALRESGREEAAERVLGEAPAEVRELFARRTAATSPAP